METDSNDKAKTAAHSDFGEKIGGAKKDLWQKRGLLSDDLNEMNDREAEMYVKKDNVWKKPDYQALVDSGIPADVVYYIKTIRDSVETAPLFSRNDDTPEKRLSRQMEYIDTVREIQGIVESVKTKDDVFAVFGKYMVNNGYYENKRPGARSAYYGCTDKGLDNTTITDKLSRAMLIASELDYKQKITHKAEKVQFGVAKDSKVPQGYEILYNDGKNSWSANDDWKPDTYYVVKGRGIVKTNFESHEEALKWIHDLVKQLGGNGKKRFVPEQLKDVVRDGPDYRRGKDVTGADYLETFGFKGGEFGNWMTQNDRQASLNYGYDALKDLAAALKISDKDIAFQGELSIAFGARGSGNAAAHYEPMRKVINLTKMNGAGSLAHEWWHGIDDFLGSKMGTGRYVTENPRRNSLYAKLIETIKYKPQTSEQAAASADEYSKRVKRNAESWLKAEILSVVKYKGGDKELAEYETLKDAFLRGETGALDKLNILNKSVTKRVIRKNIRDKLETFERLLRGIAENLEPKIGKAYTDYYRNSMEMGKVSGRDGNYWDSNIELSARAFATYVLDTLPNRSDYLAGHAECAVGIKFDSSGETEVIRAFPQGEERKAINAVFDEIIAELKLQQYLTHDEHEQQIQPTTSEAMEEIPSKLPEHPETTANEPLKPIQSQEIKTRERTEPPTVMTGGFFDVVGGQLSLFPDGVQRKQKALKPSILAGIADAKAKIAEADKGRQAKTQKHETDRE